MTGYQTVAPVLPGFDPQNFAHRHWRRILVVLFGGDHHASYRYRLPQSNIAMRAASFVRSDLGVTAISRLPLKEGELLMRVRHVLCAIAFGACLGAVSSVEASTPVRIFENANLVILEGGHPLSDQRMAVRNVSADGRFALINDEWGFSETGGGTQVLLYDLQNSTFSPPIDSAENEQSPVVQIRSITRKVGGGYSMVGTRWLRETDPTQVPVIIDFGSTGYRGEEPIVGPCFQDLQDGQQVRLQSDESVVRFR